MATVGHEKPSQRLVPSGKVYRQIFDAEVQLVKSLRKAQKAKHDTSTEVDRRHKGANIPVVHMTLPKSGMLDERQITWLEEFPNEPYTENPTVYKYYSEEANMRSVISETGSLATKEVRGLPDVIVPAKVGSDIIDRISLSRKQRHEAAVEDMYHELGLISTEIEPQVSSSGDCLLHQLSENDVELEDIISEMMTDEALRVLSMDDLEAIWNKVMLETLVRKTYINELDDKLKQLEKLRIEKVRTTFEDTAAVLEQIGHFVLADIQRLLDKECQVINQMILSNKRAYADLNSRLMLSTVEQEKRLYVQWTKQVEKWKDIHLEFILDKFTEFMSSAEITNPPSIKLILDEMMKTQNCLNEQRLNLVSSFRDLQPPLSTKTVVAEWHQKLVDISKDIDSVNQEYFTRLCLEYEKMCKTCVDEVDRVKMELIEREICTTAKATEIINTKCLPLVGNQQTQYEKIMEDMDKSLEEQGVVVLGRLKELFKFSQSAAHCWDLHEIGLARCEKELREKIEEVRLINDVKNKETDDSLTTLLDRMRQDGTEVALKEGLSRALKLLDTMKNGYDDNHKEQSEIIATYPDAVRSELLTYDQAVCVTFGVQKIVKPENDTKDEEEEEEEEEESENSKILVTKNGTRYCILDDEATTKETPPPPPKDMNSDRTSNDEAVKSINEEEEEEEEEEMESTLFLTESKDSSVLSDYIKSIDVDEKFLKDVRVIIRMNFLDHLDVWVTEAIERSKVVVDAKMEQLKKELDLQLHLHEPKARRIELDIYNVRAAELVMHSERVARHCKAAEQTMDELKLMFTALTDEQNKMADKFSKDINRLESVFINATKSSKLTQLSSQLLMNQEKFMEQIRTSSRQFRQHLDKNIQTLRESNAKMIKSFKLFSEGGNFCVTEVVAFRDRQNKLSSKIDQCEGSLIGNLENIESKRLEQSLKVTREFEDRFKYQMVDLVFMEKVSRCLTNTQVKIKTEVAFSNSASQKISEMLLTFDRRLDACEQPNLDKEAVIPSKLLDDLVPMYETADSRSFYLKCLKDPLSAPTSMSTMQGNPALGGRVSFVAEGVTCISRPGKHQLDDLSINVIRNILKTQKKRLGEDVNSDDALNSDGQMKQNTSAKSSKNKKHGSKKETKKKARIPSGKGKIDKKYLVFGEVAEDGEENYYQGKIKKILRESLEALLVTSELYYKQKGSRPVTRPQVLQESFDECAEVLVQKCQFYQTQSDEYHSRCIDEFRDQLITFEKLAGRVSPVIIKELERSALKELQTELNQMEEDFAKEMSNSQQLKELNQEELRPVLGHPQQEERLKDLCKREEERQDATKSIVLTHSQLLTEIVLRRAKLFIQDLARTSENLLLQFDSILVIDEIINAPVTFLKLTTNELIRRSQEGQTLETKVKEIEVKRGRNIWQGIPNRELTLPSQKQPSNTSMMSKKSNDEVKMEKSDENLKTALTSNVVPQKSSNDIVTAESAVKISSIENTTTASLSDVATKKSDENMKTTSAENMKKASSSSTSSKKSSSSNENLMTASITTAKTTLGHTSTVETRDAVYQEYKCYFESTVATIENDREKRNLAEERWTQCWKETVERVKELY